MKDNPNQQTEYITGHDFWHCNTGRKNILPTVEERVNPSPPGSARPPLPGTNCTGREPAIWIRVPELKRLRLGRFKVTVEATFHLS